MHHVFQPHLGNLLCSLPACPPLVYAPRRATPNGFVLFVKLTCPQRSHAFLWYVLLCKFFCPLPLLTMHNDWPVGTRCRKLFSHERILEEPQTFYHVNFEPLVRQGPLLLLARTTAQALGAVWTNCLHTTFNYRC